MHGTIIYANDTFLKFGIQFVNLGLWGVATASASAALYGLHDAFNGHPLSNEVSSLYNALSRTVWGAAVSWVIFACGTGNGGTIIPFERTSTNHDCLYSKYVYVCSVKY